MDAKVETNVEHKRHLSVGNRGGFEGGRGSSLSAISSVPVEIETGRTGTVRLSEAQQVVLARASANEDARLIWPWDSRPVGAAAPEDGFGSTPNDRRCIEALYLKGMLDGDVDDLLCLKLTTKAFVALQIDPIEWPERLREDGSAADAVTVVGVAVEEADAREEDPTFASRNSNALMTKSSSLTQNMRAGSKGAALIDLLARDGGATLDELQQASGWQAHSVRGFLSGTVRRKLGGQWRLVDAGAPIAREVEKGLMLKERQERALHNAEASGEDTRLILPHPDDIVIDYSTGYKVLGLWDEEELLAVERKVRERHVWLLQAELERRYHWQQAAIIAK